MQPISFKNTILFKRGMWLSGAALIAFVVSPSVLDGSLRQNPIPHLFAAGILSIFWIYFLTSTQIHRLADEVVDCDDHLKVRRGRTEAIIPFSIISKVDVATNSGIHRFTVHLRKPTTLGSQIAFLPQASLWSDRFGVQCVATSLTERANRANEQRLVK
jgi:hypothetical protein